jgi:hypothetical protein
MISAMAGSDDEPYLALAREIRAEAERLVEHGGDLGAAVDRLGHDERARLARAALDALSPERRWEVLAQLFDDDELRAHLAADHAALRADVARHDADRAAARRARAAGCIDLDALAPDTTVGLGLFRPVDVRDALRAGPASTTCARSLLVRATAGPEVHVLADVFNPERGLFVTPDYDERVWATERLASHDRVRLGSIGSDGFEHLLFAGGRVDVDGHPGLLHLGWARIGDADVFTDSSVPR